MTKYSPGQLILYKSFHVSKTVRVANGFYVIVFVNSLEGWMKICPLSKYNQLKKGEDGKYIVYHLQYRRNNDIQASCIKFPIKEKYIPNFINLIK